jgi:2-methylcitrate dehydratase PrpD
MTAGHETTNPSITDRFADRVLGVSFTRLPSEAIEIARQVTLDGIAVILAGSAEPLGVGRIVTDHVRQSGGNPEASVIAGGFKTSMANAAFANGTMAHALDFDNTFYPLNHPTSPTLPAIFAIAEAKRLPGAAVIEAIVAAFEVQARLRMAATGLDTGKGFHKPGTTGTIGATVAAAKLLGLNKQQLLMALGTAGSRAGSLSINTGSMTKSSHSGHAARMGVECAILAGMGWTASADLFGPGGFFDAFAGGRAEPEALIEHFGEPFRMVDPGVGFKKYPCNYFTHRPIDAALALREEHAIQPRQIARVLIRFPAFDYVNRPSPATGLDGKFSVQYTAAIALLDGYVTVGSFSNERRFAADVEALLPKVDLLIDQSIPNDFTRMHVEVSITLTDGRVVTKRLAELSGFVGYPLDRDVRLKKFFACADGILSRDKADQVLRLVETMDQLPDIIELMDLLR